MLEAIGKMLFRLVMILLDLTMKLVVMVTSPLFALMYESQKGKLPPVNNDLFLKPATEVAKMIRTRQVRCVEVMELYIGRIREVNQVLNAIVAERFKSALLEAQKLDDILDSGKIPEEYAEEKTPFLGIPFTAKEAFGIKGLPNTSGLLNRKNVIAEKDADVIRLMCKAGAIPVGLSNCSELCMWYESSNLIYGRTNNAYHQGRIVGGSSGGEGCIISSAGSIIGVGSDIGGSIRLPSFFNGIFGHKPTNGVISNKGQFPNADGEAASFLTTGPMCRYADDLLPMFKVMMEGSENLDKLKLDTKVDISKLRVHYMFDDGGSYVISAVDKQIKQAISKAVDHLKSRKASIECVSVHDLRHSFDIWTCKMTYGQKESFCHLMGSGQAVNPLWELIRWLMLCPRHTLPAIGLGLVEKVKHPPAMKKKLYEKCDYLRQQLEQMLGDDGVFIYPSYPRPAPYHNQPLTLLADFAYTGIFNLLGLPSTSVPMGLGKEGVPIGFQVVASRYNDHLSMAVARELEKAFGGWVPPFEIKKQS
jgi:fatty acid amide hydrolase 2